MVGPVTEADEVQGGSGGWRLSHPDGDRRSFVSMAVVAGPSSSAPVTLGLVGLQSSIVLPSRTTPHYSDN